MEHEGDGNTNSNWCARNNTQSQGKGTGRFRNWKTIEYHPKYSIVKIGQDIEKSPGDLRKTCCHSDPSESASGNDGVKNSQRVKQ